MNGTDTIPQPIGDQTAEMLVAGQIRAVMGRLKMSATDVVNGMTHPSGRGTVDPTWLQRRLSGSVHLTLDDVQWIAAALDTPMAVLLQDLIPVNYLAPTNPTT